MMSRWKPAVVLLCLAAFCRPAGAADWPQWRGPGRDGVCPGLSLPDRLPDQLPARWRQKVGGGYGGIAVAGGHVYVMDRQKEPAEVERVLCLDAGTGKLLWVHAYAVSYGKMSYGNGPRSTPTADGERVYTFGAVGHLHCLDARTGKVLWQIDTVREMRGRVPTWGHACSPLVDGRQVIVQVGGQPGACLTSFDRDTGKELWRSLPDRPGYASPAILERGGRRLLVTWTPEHVVGLDPGTGEVRWRVPFPVPNDVSISDVVWDGDVLLASNYWSGSKAIRLDAEGGSPEVVWEGKQLSLLMSTPLVRGGMVYAIDRFRGLKCLDLRTGGVKWEGEHVTPRGSNPQATLVRVGESRALVLNERGELLLVGLGPEGLRSLGRAPLLEGRIWAHPALARGCVFARSDEEIVCVPLPGR